MKTVIIGGVAGGASCAARLRRLDESAQIVMLERGEYISFANCGLPYYVGGEITEKGKLTLQTPESFKARFNVDVRVMNEAIAIDTKNKTVTVKNLRDGSEYTENYDTLLLSPGAEPILPPIKGADCKRVFTLRSIPDTLRIREFVEEAKAGSVAVVGGGYIGVEMAENLKTAGLDVTLIEMADHLVAPLDYDMAADLHSYVRDKGIDLRLGTAVTAITESGDKLLLELGKESLIADAVIMAVGVRPETSLAKAAGLSLNERGAIIVDSRMRTSHSDIYAVGDAVQVQSFVTDTPTYVPLAGPANKQGRIAADNICSIPSEYGGTQGSAVLKVFDMTVATTGLNEKAAKAAGFDYDKAYTYSASHATYYPGGGMMSFKLLWDKKTHLILGAQIVGYDGVDKRMDVIATAMRLGAKVTELAKLELCYAPPFGSAKDPVNMMGYIAENLINGKLRQFFWDQVDSLPRDGSVTLLDTRTVTEYRRGHIDGFVNVPLDSLRENLHLLPKDKPIYVHCHSGLRSYIACRILTGNGYECYNLSGGWRLYEAVTKERAVPPYICTDCK